MCASIPELRAFRGALSSADEVFSGVESIERNARELLDDARLLLEHGRYARSMSLAIIAYEEATKSEMLLTLYAVQADEKQRKRVWKDYLSHIHKSGFLGSKESDLSSFFEKSANAEENYKALQGAGEEFLKKLQDTGKMIDRYKQLGFYADMYEHEGLAFGISPSEAVSAEMVVEGISARFSARFDETTIEQRKADIREHVRVMDQHPKADSVGRFVALSKSRLKADLEAHKRKRIRELREEARRRQDGNGP